MGRTLFVSRHKGAHEWAERRGLDVEMIIHLDTQIIEKGDHVIGTLPAHLAAEICEKGGRYFHLALDLLEDDRARDLSADEMEERNARLQEYDVRSVK